jgi:tRNA-dihydrouridine synthase
MVADSAPPDIFFTEFVNVDGLQSPGRPKLLHKLAVSSKEGPVIAQLWGLKPENFRKTAQEIADGTLAKEANELLGRNADGAQFVGVDLNMGCPVKTVIKNGACSALINNRALAGEIIAATREGAHAKGNKVFPVSVKTRVGFTTIDLSWTEFLLQQKLNMLTIHGRTTREMSKVPAHWDVIGEVAKQRASLAPQTLLVGNGDVVTRQQGLRLAKDHGLDGIMVGRGVFEDPFVFAEQSPWLTMTEQQKRALYAKHVKLFADTWAHNERRLITLNKFCKVYIQGFPGAKELREQLMAAQTTEELLGALSA